LTQLFSVCLEGSTLLIWNRKKSNKKMKLAQRDNQEFLLEHSARFFATLFRRHFLPRKVRYALMTALALNVAPFSCANAQQFSSIVAFGDSYADTGNIWKLMEANPAATSNPVMIYTIDTLNWLYPHKKFSDETNYVDTLASIYGISQDSQYNYAIGGAQTGSLNQFNKFDYPHRASPICRASVRNGTIL
jgi:GDSL-like Lipase/Acylhydrolase